MFPGQFRMFSILEGTQRCTIPKAQADHTITATTTPDNRTNVGVRVGNVTAQVRYVAIHRF